ncbi:MAG TPA: DUF1501 domain-containing protein [Planctomycetota bacterium]|jgi:hypothetical protein|nr:DUF1501 domain-containing protein [Planctomycetota bacterium]
MEPIENITRRRFFRMSTAGLGSVALGSLLSREAGAQEIEPHFAPKAKHLIYLFMNGGASQMDLYDYKPKMEEMFDKDLPPSIINGQRLTTMTSGQSRFPVAPSMFKFKQHGQSGAWISELLPNIARHADKISFIKSVHTEAINHDPAVTYICTGAQIPGKASLGSWLSYGLGSENDNLPSFIVMTPSWSAKREAQALYNRLWGSGFLPTRYQGVWFRLKGDPVLYLSDPPGVSRETRRQMLEAVVRMNAREYAQDGDPETQGRIAQYEMAFKMQSSVPDLVDFSKEPKHIQDMYGPDLHKPGTFAQSAILARRMIERGVRQVQIFHREWDHHGNLPTDLRHQCSDVDQPIAALLTDLEMRGLLDETLVVWGSEFGRTAYCQGKLTRTDYGRDHHPRCFVHWFAGAGVKPGVTHGETDDFSYNIVKDPVHIRDINATILHLMGMDHKRLIYKFQGLDQRLTGVEEEAKVVKSILA